MNLWRLTKMTPKTKESARLAIESIWTELPYNLSLDLLAFIDRWPGWKLIEETKPDNTIIKE